MIVDILGYEGLYKVSDEGVIISCQKKHGFLTKEQKNLKPKINKGYESVGLRKEKKTKWLLVHRLVYSNFIGEIPHKLQINHKDGNKRNNRIENLEVVTSSENLKHAFRTGLKSLKGEKHNNRKLNWEDVLFIRKSTLKNCELAEKYNVSRAMITHIKNPEKYKRWLTQ